MAALTRSGARKASEIVMLIFLTLQFSRLAMVPAVIAGSAISSSSQRRRGSQRRLAGIFCHGTSSVLGGSARWMTSRSRWTSTRKM